MESLNQLLGSKVNFAKAKANIAYGEVDKMFDNEIDHVMN